MENFKIIIGYGIYLPISLLLTYYVAKTLFNNSVVFMLAIFRGKEDIAHATNTLFKVGFYLLNIGFALLILKIHSYEITNSYQSLIEILSKKIGSFSIYLGVMLFINMYLFFRGKKKSKESKTSKNLNSYE